jgi:hypothetical protein
MSKRQCSACGKMKVNPNSSFTRCYDCNQAMKNQGVQNLPPARSPTAPPSDQIIELMQKRIVDLERIVQLQEDEINRLKSNCSDLINFNE